MVIKSNQISLLIISLHLKWVCILFYFIFLKIHINIALAQVTNNIRINWEGCHEAKLDWLTF